MMMVQSGRFAAAGGPPAGPPVFQANGALATLANVSSIDVAYPAGLANYDVAFLHINCTNGNVGTITINTPSGWTQVDQRVFAADEWSHALFWKRLDGTESGNQTVTSSASVGTSGSLSGAMSIIRGGLSTGTPYEDPDFNSGLSAAPTGKAVTTTGVDRLVCNFYTYSNDENFTAETGSGWTERYDLESSVGADKSLVLTTKAQATAATVTAETGAIVSGNRWGSFSLAVITN